MAQRTVNPERVAAAIAEAARSERHVSPQVTCPAGVPLEHGVQFYCVAQVGPQITAFRVTQGGTEGHVTFVGVRPDDVPPLATASVAREIAATVQRTKGVQATVRCPADMPRQQGLSFVCSATEPSGRVTLFVVRQLDGDGHVSYREA